MTLLREHHADLRKKELIHQYSIKKLAIEIVRDSLERGIKEELVYQSLNSSVFDCLTEKQLAHVFSICKRLYEKKSYMVKKRDLNSYSTFYGTFSQGDRHSIYRKTKKDERLDSYYVMVVAIDAPMAVKKMNEIFKNRWSTIYCEEEFKKVKHIICQEEFEGDNCILRI